MPSSANASLSKRNSSRVECTYPRTHSSRESLDPLNRVLPPAPDVLEQDLRSRLTSNRTLSHISWRYGLAKNLIFKQSGCQLKSAREDEQRLAANAIEAYCGSVVEPDRGDESAVAKWLEEKLLVPQVFPAFEHITKSMEVVPDGTSTVPQKRPRLDTGDPVRGMRPSDSPPPGSHGCG